MDQRQHPIEQIMETTLENLKQMIDVNTIVGDSMVMADGTMIVPARISCPLPAAPAPAYPSILWHFWWSPAGKCSYCLWKDARPMTGWPNSFPISLPILRI